MVPLYDSVKKDPKEFKLYYKRQLKWYEKIWYFLIGKKNEYKELGLIKK